MKILAPLVLAVSLAITGCVVVPVGYDYPVGYYNPASGFWTGTVWDFNFYAYGHPGYHHWYGYGPHRYSHYR